MKTLPEPDARQQDAARLTAWALNELSAEERAQFAGDLSADAALNLEAEAIRGFCRRLEADFRSSASTTLPDPPLRISDAARLSLEQAAVAASSGGGRPSGRRRVLSLWMPSLAAAACVAVMVTVYWNGRNGRETARAGFPQGSGGGSDRLVSGKTASPHEPANLELAVQPPLPEKPLSGGAPPLVAGRGAAAGKVLSEAETSLWAAAGADGIQKKEHTEFFLSAGQARPLSTAAAADQLSAIPRLMKLSDGYAAEAVQGARHYAYVPPEMAGVRNGSLAEGIVWKGVSAESYRGLPENAFLTPLEQPLSTFSIDVDTASYAIVRRHLNQGAAPPPEAVRLEEMINYFPMDDAPPPAESAGAAAAARPFAVHVETASAPWTPGHRLVRVALKGRVPAMAERGPANLVFLVDTSGSMDQPDKLPLVQQSLQFLLTRLELRDRVSLVTYAGESRVVLPPTPLSERAAISAAINSLSSAGGTNGSGGITAAYAQARASFIPGGVNRVILATDGDFNIGLTSEAGLQDLITSEAKSGVYLSVLGYGSDNLKDTTAELLADKGNGNYAYIDSLGEARRALGSQLGGTLVTIAKDVKIQVEFNPAAVSRYRLLGYENRALADRDFNDDTKDAGEIGAGHSVTALYEIIPAVPGSSSGAAVPADPLKYQEPPRPAAPQLTGQAASGELLTVKLRWQKPEGTAPSELLEMPVRDSGGGWEQASANFRWTAAVAGCGLLLRGSAHAGSLTWEAVRTLAAGSKGADPDGFRGEFLQLVDKAASHLPRPAAPSPAAVTAPAPDVSGSR